MFGPDRVVQHLQRSGIRRKEAATGGGAIATDETYESNRVKFVKAIDEAERNHKIPLANEHWFNVLKPEHYMALHQNSTYEAADLGRNPTYLPDDIFDALTTIVLIRRPALSVDSIYRAALAMNMQEPGDEDFDLIATNRPLRVLFD